jgi:hypothetical protein
MLSKNLTFFIFSLLSVIYIINLINYYNALFDVCIIVALNCCSVYKMTVYLIMKL